MIYCIRVKNNMEDKMENYKVMAKVFADCNNLYNDNGRNLDYKGEFEDFESFRKTLLTSVRYYNWFDARRVLESCRYVIEKAKGKLKFALAREGSPAIYVKLESINDANYFEEDGIGPVFNCDEFSVNDNEIRMWWD